MADLPATVCLETLTPTTTITLHSPLCFCICCSLQGRCSYEERQQANRTLHPPTITSLSSQLQQYQPPHAIQGPPPLSAAILCVSFIDPLLKTNRMDNETLGGTAYLLLKDPLRAK